MPSFAGAPTGWVTDRYQPTGFSDVGSFQGYTDVLGISISSAQDFTNRPSNYQYTFYNTQGMQHAVTGGAGTQLDAALYIPATWSNPASGSVRTDMWGVTVDGANSVTDYPIIGFTNYGGTARYRVWDETLNGNAGAWVDLATAVNYSDWTAFGIQYDGTDINYFINGVDVYSYTEDPTTVGFSATIMQAYNFGGDPSITGANPVNYTADWANIESTPEPGAILLLTTVIAGVFFGRRKLAVRA